MSDLSNVNKDYKNIFVKKTDPKFTKRVKIGKMEFTSIDSYYLIQEATKDFGLFGEGWGIKEVSWEHITLKDAVIAKLEATFFTPKGSFPITNSDKLYYVSTYGKEIIDTDVYKKIETNTIAKALSRLGYGTDIFLGNFEDFSYTEELINETQLCNNETLEVLRGELMKSNVSADVVTKHFVIRALKDLKYKDFNEAVSLIRASKKDE